MSENQDPAPEPAGPDQPGPLPPGWAPPVTAAAPPPASPPVPGARPNRGLAVASLILGAVALPLDLVLGAGVFIAIPAIIAGAVAMRRIRRTGEEGRGLAIAGLIIGCAAVALAVFVVYVVNEWAATCYREQNCW